jgi:hypothetical protein
VGVDQKAFLSWQAGRVAETPVIDSKDVAAGCETTLEEYDAQLLTSPGRLSMRCKSGLGGESPSSPPSPFRSAL